MCFKNIAKSFLTLGVAAALLASTQSASAQLKRSDTKVKIKVAASKLNAANAQTVMVNIKIDKGWHLYANPPGNDFFKSIATTMKVKGVNVKSAKIQYPKGTQKIDKSIGKYNIYKNEVTLTAFVQRTNADRSPLEVSVTLSACDAGKCLLPATVKLMVK